MNKKQKIISLKLIIAFIYVLILNLSPIIQATQLFPEYIKQINIGQFQAYSANKSQQILSYYDVNQDQHSDILTLSTIFSNQNDNMISLGKQQRQNNVKSVMCTQFYERQNIEIDLVLTYDDYQEAQSQKYSISFWKIICSHQDITETGNKCKFTTSYNIQQLKKVDYVLPSLIVINGQISVIYSKNNQAFTITFNKNNNQQVSLNPYVIQSLKQSKYLSFSKQNKQISQLLGYELSYFGDYNVDGIPDLILAEKILENQFQYTKIHFFKYDKSLKKHVYDATFSLKSIQQKQNTKFQFFTLTDINFDGRIDLLVLFKSGLLSIHYNIIPTSDSELLLQNSFNKLPFDLFFNQSSQNYHISKIQHIQLPQKPTNQASIIFGDLNNDGFQDMIIDIQTINGQQKSLFLLNQQCKEASDCGVKNFNLQFINTLDLFSIRKFSVFSLLPSSYRTSESYRMTFIDLYKDGKLDLISHSLSSNLGYTLMNTQQKIKQRNIQVYYNSGYYDSFFMKVTVVTGTNYLVTDQNTVTIGASVNCFVTSLSGIQLPKTGNQLTQVGRALQLPYVFFGLGRSNNYVNELTITIPYINQNKQYRYSWTPIIPNSQIIIVTNPEGKWQLTTFIEPTKKMGTVTLLVILALAAIGFAICRLTASQKQEDKDKIQVLYTILK